MVEAQPDAAARCAATETCAPGFVNDTFSAFYPMAAASPVIAGLRLEEHGLRWRHAPGGARRTRCRTARLGGAARDRDDHGRASGRRAAGRRRGVAERMVDEWRADGTGAGRRRCSPRCRRPPRARRLRCSCRASVASTSCACGSPRLSRRSTCAASAAGVQRGRGARMLVAGNAMHADLSLGVGRLGAVSVCCWRCSARRSASRRRRAAPGGSPRRWRLGCGRRAAQVVHRRPGGPGRGRERPRHRGPGRRRRRRGPRRRRAVLADVAAPQLYRAAAESGPSTCRSALARARAAASGWNRATVKVDWALSGPVPWTAAGPPPAPAPCTCATALDELTDVRRQLAAGRVPGAAVHAGRPDDHRGPDPLAGRHRVGVGLHPRARSGCGATPGAR